jgi:hypothetical protein
MPTDCQAEIRETNPVTAQLLCPAQVCRTFGALSGMTIHPLEHFRLVRRWGGDDVFSISLPVNFDPLHERMTHVL